MFKSSSPWQVLCATLEPRVEMRVGALVVLSPFPASCQGEWGGRGGWTGCGMLGGERCWHDAVCTVMGMWQMGTCYPKGAVLGYRPQGITNVWLHLSAHLCTGGGPADLTPPRGQHWHQIMPGIPGHIWNPCPAEPAGRAAPGLCTHGCAHCRVWCSAAAGVDFVSAPQ